MELPTTSLAVIKYMYSNSIHHVVYYTALLNTTVYSCDNNEQYNTYLHDFLRCNATNNTLHGTQISSGLVRQLS